MRISILALYSCLIAAAASASISNTNNDFAESSLSALLERDASSPSSSFLTNLSFAKREEEVVEEVVELDDDDDDDDDEDEDDPETSLESRARKHRHRKHHRSRKHRSSSSKSHRRSKHRKHHSSHSVSTSSSNNSGSFKGKGTFFKPNKGACGKRNTVNDYIVALSSDVYKGGKHCFGGVKVCYGGKCVSAKVADLCPGCHRTSLDMSLSLFKALADPDLGVIDISWSFT